MTQPADPAAVGSPRIVGDNTILFGTAGVYGSGIIVSSASNKLDGDKLEIKDNKGSVTTVIYFNDKNQCSFEMLVSAAAPTLARGDAITIGGVVNCLVDNTELKWTNDNTQKFTVNATRYPNVTIAS